MKEALTSPPLPLLGQQLWRLKGASQRGALVLLHGFAGQPALWGPVIGRLGATRKRACLVRLPGHGRRPQLPERASASDGKAVPSFETLVDQLAAALAPRAPFELAGYSMGARIALCLALRHPHLVHRLWLVGVSPGLEGEVERVERQAWERSMADELEQQGLPAFMLRWQNLALFSTQKALPAEVQARQRRHRFAHRASGLAWAMRALGSGAMPSLWSQLVTSRIPTTLINGSEDAKYRTLGERIRELSPGITHEVVAGSGHNVVLEAPQAIARLLTQG